MLGAEGEKKKQNKINEIQGELQGKHNRHNTPLGQAILYLHRK